MFLDGLAPLARGRPARLDPAPVPELVLPVSENRAPSRRPTERLRDGRLTGAVEFRNATWLNEKNTERTLALPRRRKIPFVMVDEPQGFKSASRRSIAAPSPDLALVRFHGRRNADVGGEGHPDRRALPLPLRERRARGVGAADPRGWPAQAKEIHVLFNNCYANYGTTNARELAQLLLDLQAGQRN